ncbi:MAG: sugar-binding domain-containing protein, partial [Candidatus Roseilinea sp.]|uniref:sugar-binding domain-containing protein n=1 Tax=Candidatus Roseilinea sp. TaxID=2838777 RepID=UPI00404956D7
VFARIASQLETEQRAALVEPQPPALPAVSLSARRHDPAAAFKPLPKLDTPAKLQRELARQRRRFAPFMRDLSPALESLRQIIPITAFDWRLQTHEDATDFGRVLSGAGEWQPVSIPHYGGPIGKATAYYRATFNLGAQAVPERRWFIRFKGVDYKAHVFVNGAYLGSHEGFFAPFEFDMTRIARAGENTPLVVVENDAIMLGNETWDKLQGVDAFREGDKIYAATGPGWDDPQVGWHHCPPGMGIYQDVFIEARAPIHIHDVFVRPLLAEGRAEAWIEVNSAHAVYQPVALRLLVYGQNFRQTVFANRVFSVGDAGPGVSYYRLSFDMPKAQVWDVDAPWLYQAQVKLLDGSGRLLDTARRQFGMRSFHMDDGPEAAEHGEWPTDSRHGG